MRVYFRVNKDGDPHWQRDFQFAKDVITIGRDASNDLQLFEGSESGVSRQHAKIRAKDKSFKLIDLFSRNFTFLNEEKLEGGVEYEIKDGDQIKIGDFRIHFSVGIDEVDKEQALLQILDEDNPFLKESKELTLILSRISQKYETVDSLPRDAALEAALKKAFFDMEMNQSLEVIRSVINGVFSLKMSSPTQQDFSSPAQADFQYFHNFIDILLDFLVKSDQACKEFRVNFAGETLVKSQRLGSLGGRSSDEIKNFLLDPNIPLNDLEKRLKSVQDMADEIMLHQLALLEGHKGSIAEGTKHILDRLNPRKYTEKKLRWGKIAIPLRFIPILNYLRLARSWKSSYSELAQEDQSIMEKKYFRPGYVRGYNRRMDLSRKKKV